MKLQLRWHNCRNLLLLFAAAFVLPAPRIAEAHHGAAAHYDFDTQLTLEGTVSNLRFVNPHAYIYFDLGQSDGSSESWRCELGGASQLITRGWDSETFQEGEQIVVVGKPARREDRVCYVDTIQKIGGATYSRMGINTTDDEPAPDSAPPPRTVESYIADGEGFFDEWVALRVPGARWRPFLSSSEIDGIERATLPMDTPLPVVTHTAAGQIVADAYEFIYDNPLLRCESSILGGIVHNSLPNIFAEDGPDRIKITYGMNDLERTIHMNQTAPPAGIEPALLGYSVGHWEGDTLVVETAAFRTGVFVTTEGQVGHNSGELRYTERFTIDPELDHLVLEYTAADPLNWEEPVSGVARFIRSATPWQPYNCVDLSGENNRRPE